MNSGKIFFIRHAPIKKVKGYFPKYNSCAIINKRRFKSLAKYLPPKSIWYVSPLRRAVQTAKILSEYVSYSEINQEEKLVEQNYGDWAGQKIFKVWSEIKNKKKHNFSFISPDVSPPNGESFLKQCDRVSHWLTNLNIPDGNNVIVITHAGTIRAALVHILEINPQKAVAIEINHLSVSIFEILLKKYNKHVGGKFRLLTLNKEIEITD